MSVGYKVCLTLYYSPFVTFSEVPLYPFFFILHVNSLNLCHCQTWWLRLCRGQWASAQVKQNQKWKTKLAVYWLPIRCKRVKIFSHSQFCSSTNPITINCHLSKPSQCAAQTSLSADEQFADCLQSPDLWKLLVNTFSRSPESRCDNIFARIFSQIRKSLSLHSSSLNYWELARSTFCQCLSQISS